MTERKQTLYLVVHASATPPDLDIGIERLREIHTAPETARFDMGHGIVFKGRDWSDVGYHYAIRRSGGVETGRGVLEAGAHVRGYNNRSVGVCLIGGVDTRNVPEDNFTPAQMETLVKLLRGLEVDFPLAFVQGHRDFPDVAKACPCFDVIPWWADVTESLATEGSPEEPTHA